MHRLLPSSTGSSTHAWPDDRSARLAYPLCQAQPETKPPAPLPRELATYPPLEATCVKSSSNDRGLPAEVEGPVRPVGAGQPPNRRGASQYERKAAAGAMKKLLELREIRKVALLLRVSTEDQVGGNSLTT